jgi:hypothetical protein
MESSQCENLINLFSRKVSYLTGSHCQFICEWIVRASFFSLFFVHNKNVDHIQLTHRQIILKSLGGRTPKGLNRL